MSQVPSGSFGCLEPHAAAFGDRRRRQELDDVDGLDALRPGLEGAEHVPDTLLRSIYMYRLLKAHVGRSAQTELGRQTWAQFSRDASPSKRNQGAIDYLASRTERLGASVR